MYGLHWDDCMRRLSRHLASFFATSAFSPVWFSLGYGYVPPGSSKFLTARGERELYLLLLQLEKQGPGRTGLAWGMGPTMDHSPTHYGQGMAYRVWCHTSRGRCCGDWHLHTQPPCQNRKRNISQIKDSMGLAIVNLPFDFCMIVFV